MSPIVVLIAAVAALLGGVGLGYAAFGGDDDPGTLATADNAVTTTTAAGRASTTSTTVTASGPSTTTAPGASTTVTTAGLTTPGSTPTSYVSTADCAGVRDLLQTGTNPAMRDALTYDRAKARIRLLATGNGPSAGSQIDTKDIKLELFGEWDGVTYLVTYQVGSLRGPDKWGINGDGQRQPNGTFDNVESGTGTTFLLQGSSCSPLA